MTGLSVRADDGIQLLGSQREELVQVPTGSSADCAGADENGGNQRSGPHVERVIVICRWKPVLIDIMKKDLLELQKRNRNGRPASVGSYGQTSCERYLRNGGSTQRSTNGAVDAVDIGSYKTHYETQTRRRESNKAVAVYSRRRNGSVTTLWNSAFSTVIYGIGIGRHKANDRRSPQNCHSPPRLPPLHHPRNDPSTRRTAVVRRHPSPKPSFQSAP